MLDALNAKNPHLSKKILSIHDEEFASYGRIVTGYDFSEMIDFMEKHSQMPESGNVYIASVEELESTDAKKQLEDNLYGGMPIQVGYCNGKNQTFNGFEYHKGSEVNIAVTDMLLFLGHAWDIKDNSYKVKDAQVFFVKKGEAFEMYQTTLHLSPCRVTDDGFMDIVVLPKGTNTPLETEVNKSVEPLILHKNKWVIAHKEREPLMKQGAHAGIIGENIMLNY